MKKVKVQYRDQEIELYEFAIAAGLEIQQKSLLTSFVLPGTEPDVYWAILITQVFDEHNPPS